MAWGAHTVAIWACYTGFLLGRKYCKVCTVRKNVLKDVKRWTQDCGETPFQQLLTPTLQERMSPWNWYNWLSTTMK